MIPKFQSLSSALWTSASTINSGVQLLLSFLSLTICLFRLVLIVINLPMQCFSSMGLSSSISYIKSHAVVSILTSSILYMEQDIFLLQYFSRNCSSIFQKQFFSDALCGIGSFLFSVSL